MNFDQIVLPVVRQIAPRPRLSNALFAFAKTNPFDPARFAWPYPMYERMAADGPVAYSRLYQEWTVSGYDEVLDVLRSPNVSTAAVTRRALAISPYTKLSTRAATNFQNWLLFVDPPDHTRLRGAVSQAFTPRRIASYEPLVRTVVEQLLDEMRDDPNPDIVESFTLRFPIEVIARILGLPRELYEWLHHASTEIAGLLDILHPFDPDSMNQRFDELDQTFATLIARRRTEPQNDLISVLANETDSELDDSEIVALIVVLMFAGHETTTGLLGNSIIALSRFCDQRALLRSHPELIGNAIEELLRFDPPAQIAVRTTTGPVVAGDTTIPANANVALMIGAANRDTRKWSDADQLRLDRPDPKPISFGHGIHHCLGASLTRLEMRVALPAFLDELGDYSVDSDATIWKTSNMLRGPTHIRLRRHR